MAGNTTETLLLSVQVDIAATLKRLEELQALLQKNVGAVVALNKRFSEGKLALGEYASGQAQLLQQTKQITQEQTILTKAVEGQERASKLARQTQAAATGSVDELQAKLKETTKAYNALGEEERKNGAEGARLALSQQRQTALLTQATEERKQQAAADRQAAKDLAQLDKINQLATGSLAQLRLQLSQLKGEYALLSAAERDNTEAGQKLQAQTKAINDQVSTLEQGVGVFSRNVGNYAGAIDPLIAQLVKLQEQQKLAAPDSEAYARITPVIKGFQQQINDNAIKAGLSQDTLNAKVEKSAEAIRPAVAALVELEEEQKKVEQGTSAYTAIGFKIGQAAKEVDKAVAEVAKAPEAVGKTATVTEKATAAFGKLGDVATKLPGPLGQTAGGLAQTGQGLLTATKAALAFIATPLGLFLAAITAAFYVLKEAFTATDEGQEDLAAGMAALKGVFSVLESVVISAGKGLMLLFTEPREAAKELLAFVENQVINRLKAFGVVFDALRNGDFKQALNGVLQYATGVENVVGKTELLTSETRRTAAAAYELSRAKDKLEDQEIDAIARNEKQRQQAERLVATAKDRNLTEAQRLKNLDEADQLEKAVLASTLSIEQERLRIIQAENAESERRGVLQDDQRRAEQEQVAKLAQLEGQAATAAQTRENRRSSLQQQQLADQRTAAAARAKAAEDAAKQRIAATETELATVAAGSARELELKEQLVRQKVDLEAAGNTKTAADRKLALALSLVEINRLEDEFRQKRLAAAEKELADDIARGITALGAEKKRQDDAAKQMADNFKADEGVLERYLARRSTAIEQDYADGKLSKKQYDKAIALLDETSYNGRVLLARQFGKDTSKLDEEQAKKRRAVVVKTREDEQKLYAERLGYAQQFGQEVGQMFVDTLSQTGQSLQDFSAKVLILILDELEKYILAQQAKAFARAVAEAGPLGVVEAGLEAAAITVAFEGAKALISANSAKPFAANTGAIVPGPINSPNMDSTLMYLTPGEAVMSRPAVEAYGPVLGYLNSLVGGINFAPGFNPQAAARPTDGGLAARAVAQGVPFDYDRFAAASAKHPIDVNYVAVDSKAAARKATISAVTLGGKK